VFKVFFAAIRTALPDARYEVHYLIAEGDKVGVPWGRLAPKLGDCRGIAPSGPATALQRIAISGVRRVS